MSVQANSYPLPIAPQGLQALVPCAHGPAGCPLAVDVPALARALRAGDHDRAYRIARASNPFASTCGHGCHAPCESACRRRSFGAPVAVAALEAYATACSPPGTHASPEPCTSAHDARSVAGLLALSPAAAIAAPRSGHRVAVIGAGAAGLACAHDLALLGHTCVVFDEAPEPGGLLTRGIPAFRFPVAAARAECAAVLAMGVELNDRYRIEGSGDLRALLAGEFDAVFLAIGASHARDAMFPDQPEHAHVLDAWRVLGGECPPTREAVVLGGGDIAADAARVLRRAAAHSGALPPTVRLVLETTIEASPLAPASLVAALDDGIDVRAGWSPTRYLVDERGALVGVEIARRGDRTTMVLPCDLVVTAGARAPRAAPFAPEIACDGQGAIVVDPDTLQTSMPRVWAGGACAFGHRSIAHAAADGKRAAWSIHGALTGEPVRVAVASAWVEVDDWDPGRAERALALPRVAPRPAVPPTDPFTPSGLRAADEMAAEGARCFDCTVVPVVDERCTSCGRCVRACPHGAFAIDGGSPPRLRLDQDACTRCGVCVPSCPEGAIAMLRAVWESRLTTQPEADATALEDTLESATPAG
ncbi:MAG TPA: FAD-dependent oxidoreductase [Gemmatimonadaceae bacterium]|nr:FAD-dependent oxidoreductase [Gemmatimonadaceae bacterium]